MSNYIIVHYIITHYSLKCEWLITQPETFFSGWSLLIFPALSKTCQKNTGLFQKNVFINIFV